LKSDECAVVGSGMNDVEFVKVFDEPDAKIKYKLELPDGHHSELDLENFIDFILPKAKILIQKQLSMWHGVKVYGGMRVTLDKPNTDSELRGFNSLPEPILNEGEIDDALISVKNEMIRKFEHMQDMGSGYALKRCISAELSILHYKPIGGSSYIKLPQKIEDKKAVINVQNYDNRCHEWAVLSALYPTDEHPQRTSTYQMHLGELDYTGITFPVSIKDNDKFEKNNKDIAINVFILLGGNVVGSNRISKEHGRKHEINLLLFHGEKIYEEAPEEAAERLYVQHYAWIKKESRLLSSQISNHDGKVYFCFNCIHHYSGEDAEERLRLHKTECLGLSKKPQRTYMPTDENIIANLKNKKKCMRSPCVIYADFETMNKRLPANAQNRETDLQICSFGYIIIRCDGKSWAPVIYRGRDAGDMFIESLKKQLKWINESFSNPVTNDRRRS